MNYKLWIHSFSHSIVLQFLSEPKVDGLNFFSEYHGYINAYRK